MSDFMIAFLAAVGGATWLYAKMQRSTGGNTTNSVVVAAGAGIVIFLAMITFLGIVF
jgi:hypothetical protein